MNHVLLVSSRFPNSRDYCPMTTGHISLYSYFMLASIVNRIDLPQIGCPLFLFIVIMIAAMLGGGFWAQFANCATKSGKIWGVAVMR